jgi:hypothetical protein
MAHAFEASQKRIIPVLQTLNKDAKGFFSTYHSERESRIDSRGPILICAKHFKDGDCRHSLAAKSRQGLAGFHARKVVFVLEQIQQDRDSCRTAAENSRAPVIIF